jgi:transglutaminase-like putative cysteine protease
MVYRLPSYPYDDTTLLGWLRDPPGQLVDTLDLLNNLNTHIYRSFKYDSRDAQGVQLPNETIMRGSGTCRDFAVLMIEPLDIGDSGRGLSRDTSRWPRVSMAPLTLGRRPGAGWRGYDPTNNKLVSSEHIPVAVSREQERPLRFPDHGTVQRMRSTG